MASNSFIRSSKIVGTKAKIKGTMNIPSKKTLAEKSLQELSELKLQKVKSGGGFVATLGITFNDGKSVKSGTTSAFTTSHVFDQSKKITKIVTTVGKNEYIGISQINFFSGEELLCTWGASDDV